MKVVAPTHLLREAAAILEPVQDDVVIIGALAVQIALDDHDVAPSPTMDVDAGISIEKVDQIVGASRDNGHGAPADFRIIPKPDPKTTSGERRGNERHRRKALGTADRPRKPRF